MGEGALPAILGKAYLAEVQILLTIAAYLWFACYAGVMVQISVYAFLLIIMYYLYHCYMLSCSLPCLCELCWWLQFGFMVF